MELSPTHWLRRRLSADLRKYSEVVVADRGGPKLEAFSPAGPNTYLVTAADIIDIVDLNWRPSPCGDEFCPVEHHS